MKDRVIICDGLLACFCTNVAYGVLKVVSGKVDLDRPKAFNMARRALHAGANTIRTLRHAPWDNPVRFDFDVPGFWPLMREYVQILHQPFQGPNPPPGADVWFELFDGCGNAGSPHQTRLDKEWMYTDTARAKRVIKEAFQWLGDLPYVRFGCANESNQNATVAFHEKVLFPAFKAAGRFPISYGPTQANGLIEKVKAIAGRASFWGNDRDKLIFRQLHKISDSSDLDWFKANWMKHPIRTFLSGDGCHPRPSPQEFASVLASFFFNAGAWIELGSGPDGKVRIGFERMGDENAEAAIRAASETYKTRFGVYPMNYGKYPKDWVTPPDPDPLPPPKPPDPGPEPPPEPHKSWWEKIWEWIKEIFT